MDKTVVALSALALLVTPAIPGLAQGPGQGEDRRGGPPSECPESFEGDHWTLTVDPELPGAADVRLADGGVALASQLVLPGDELSCEPRDDRVHLSTSEGNLRAQDRADLRMDVETEDNGTAELVLADNVDVQATEDEDTYRVSPGNGSDLLLEGDGLTVTEGTVEIPETARLSLADEADEEGSSERSDREAPGEGDQRDEAAGGDGDRGGERGQAGDRGRGDGGQARSERRPTVTEGTYSVGHADVRLANDTLNDLDWRNKTLFTTLTVPGLTPAEERDRGTQLRLEGQDARVRLAGQQGLMLRADSENRLRAEIGPDVEIRQEDEHVFLSVDNLLVVLEGEDLSVTNGTVTTEELRLHARGGPHHESPVWGEDAEALGFPHHMEGRHVGFDLTEDRVGNLTVHGTPLGEVRYDPVQVTEVSQEGAHFEAEGEGFELRVQDTPAVQMRLEADNITAELPTRTTLPSGAQVQTMVTDEELRLRVDRPADALANRTIDEHRAPSGPVERTEGPQPGLETRTQEGELGIRSEDPNTITTSFDPNETGLDSNVSVSLGLSRAMLIEDTNGNSRVDVGEPALAERPLTEGTVNVTEDELVHRFPLWSGNLTVTVEPGEDTAKVTYEAEDLSPPPGTLFVLETNVQAPADANLTPTDTGVIVDNGTTQAEYSATGPVTVDGEEAWAQRSIFVDGDDRVRVLTAYPAGDNITHDPTVAVQSTATEVAERLAASPYAILVGAGLAGLLVAGTVLHRRRQRPPV